MDLAILLAKFALILWIGASQIRAARPAPPEAAPSPTAPDLTASRGA